eukprot:EG_transcript_25009
MPVVEPAVKAKPNGLAHLRAPGRFGPRRKAGRGPTPPADDPAACSCSTDILTPRVSDSPCPEGVCSGPEGLMDFGVLGEGTGKLNLRTSPAERTVKPSLVAQRTSNTRTHVPNSGAEPQLPSPSAPAPSGLAPSLPSSVAAPAGPPPPYPADRFAAAGPAPGQQPQPAPPTQPPACPYHVHDPYCACILVPQEAEAAPPAPQPDLPPRRPAMALRAFRESVLEPSPSAWTNDPRVPVGILPTAPCPPPTWSPHA